MKLKIILPFIFLFALLGILGREIFYSRAHELPSALIGQDLPEFSLPSIFPSQPPLQSSDLKKNTVLLNVFASWCSACRVEHSMLMKIFQEYHVQVIGIAYKDNSSDIKTFLKENGNPYIAIGNDSVGDVAIDLGVYGTPETFVIRNGKIIYRHVGTIDQKSWDEKIYPLVMR